MSKLQETIQKILEGGDFLKLGKVI